MRNEISHYPSYRETWATDRKGTTEWNRRRTDYPTGLLRQVSRSDILKGDRRKSMDYTLALREGLEFDHHVWQTTSYSVYHTRTTAQRDMPSILTAMSGDDLITRWIPDSGDAVNSALAAIKQKRLELGVEAAEIRGTVDLIFDTVVNLAKAFALLRRGKFTEAAKAVGVNFRKIPETLADAWLVIQFGFIPIMNLVQDSITVVQSGLSKDPEFTVKRKFGISDSGTQRQWSYDISGGGHVKFYIKLSEPDDLKRKLGQLGLDNPLSVGYAILPFSFVVDWFFNVTKALNALGAAQGATLKDGYISFNAECISRYKVSLPGPYGKESSGLAREFISRRIVYRTLPSVQVPDIRFPKSRWHAATALALIIQLTK